MVVAGSSGISINNPGRHGHIAIEANVAEFLDNPEAYVIAKMFAKLKFGMQFYRDGVATDSSKLRKSLKSQIIGD